MNQTDFVLSYGIMGIIATVMTAKSMNYDISLTHCVKAFIFSPPRIVGGSIVDITDIIEKTIFGSKANYYY